jgi:hypothetical protein
VRELSFSAKQRNEHHLVCSLITLKYCSACWQQFSASTVSPFAAASFASATYHSSFLSMIPPRSIPSLVLWTRRRPRSPLPTAG